MKLFIQIILILVIFFKTGNLLSDDNLFNVNNILLKKKINASNNELADEAIKKAYKQLISRLLLKEDIKKVFNISHTNARELVKYYNISKNSNEVEGEAVFNVSFNKEKLHNLFYINGVSYSDINDKEFYILPILIKDNNISIFSNNYFYENWNQFKNDELLEFILPLENIEIIQEINQSRKNLLGIEPSSLLKEYEKKNIAIVIIENVNSNIEKVYLKANIQNKTILKNLDFKNQNFEEVIIEIKNEITNLVKSQNLIDVRIPSFLNIKLNLEQKMNLVELNSKLKRIDLIENVYVQEFSKDFVDLRIKYLGKLDKILNEFKNQNIGLQLINEQWVIQSF